MTGFEAPLLVLPVYTALTVMVAKHLFAAFSAASQNCWGAAIDHDRAETR